MGGAPRKMGRGLQGQGEEAGFSPTGTGKCVKGPDQRGTFEGMEGVKDLKSPSSTRLEVRFPYHDSRAMTRSP